MVHRDGSVLCVPVDDGHCVCGVCCRHGSEVDKTEEAQMTLDEFCNVAQTAILFSVMIVMILILASMEGKE